MLTLTVGRNGEDYYSIEEALNAVPYNEEAEIIISEGIYREKLFSDKKNLHIRGKGTVVISYSDYGRKIMPDGLKMGTFRSYTAFFSGERLTLENLRIENSAGSGKEKGQAIALYLDVDNAELNSVSLFGFQDTLFLSPLPEKEREERGFYGPRVFSKRKKNRVVINGGSITGSIDFIFGGSDALFNNVDIISNEEGFVAAPSTAKEDIGFVFNKCTFSSLGLPKHSVYLMRPWREFGKCTFIDCTFSSHIHPDGLSAWPGREGEVNNAMFLSTPFVFNKGWEVKDKEEIIKRFS